MCLRTAVFYRSGMHRDANAGCIKELSVRGVLCCPDHASNARMCIVERGVGITRRGVRVARCALIVTSEHEAPRRDFPSIASPSRAPSLHMHRAQMRQRNFRWLVVAARRYATEIVKVSITILSTVSDGTSALAMQQSHCPLAASFAYAQCICSNASGVLNHTHQV